MLRVIHVNSMSRRAVYPDTLYIDTVGAATRCRAIIRAKTARIAVDRVSSAREIPLFVRHAIFSMIRDGLTALDVVETTVMRGALSASVRVSRPASCVWIIAANIRPHITPDTTPRPRRFEFMPAAAYDSHRAAVAQCDALVNTWDDARTADVCQLSALESLAFIAARRAVKTVYNKEGTEKMRELLNAAAHYEADRADAFAVSSDFADLVQTAAAALVESVPASWCLSVDAWACMVSAALARREEFDGIASEYRDAWYSALRAVRRDIIAAAAAHGRKTITSVRTVKESPCAVTRADGTTRVINTGADVVLERKTAYPVEFVTINAPAPGVPGVADHMPARDELESSFAGVSFVHACREAQLSADDCDILERVIAGWTERDIATAWGYSQQRVHYRIARARRLLARTETYKEVTALAPFRD